MDASVRQLLLYASSVEEALGVKAVLQAFKSLHQAFNESKNNDGTETCGSDLYVQCAEVAYKLKQVKVCQESLHMYFNGTPLTNQFLCRAYFCQAQLLSPKSADDVVDFETSVVHLLKAINFAKDKPRYHFIVYNASVLYWKIARPFLRQGFKTVLRKSLKEIVQALEFIQDQDYEWRAMLMITLVESYLDGGNIKEAAIASQAAGQFCTTKAPSRYRDVLALQTKHKLIDVSKISKEVGSIPEFNAFFKLQKLKMSTKSFKANVDLLRELQKLMSVVTGKVLQPVTPSSKPASREKKARPFPVDSIVSDDNRPPLLIEIARLCIEFDEVGLCKECLSLLKECKVVDPNLLMEVEFIECELLVKELGEKQETYVKSSVEVRLAAIKRMDQAIQNAVRAGNANTVQGACATQWNLCLPLLQRNLRNHVRGPLTRLAQALEDISSLLLNLRCQVHTELAKCEESVEQIEAAVKHLNKALLLDESGVYHERLQTMLHRLQLSTQLYRTPDRPEDVAAIIIEQARKSSDSGSSDMKRSLLIKAGLALAPDAFQNVLDSEDEIKARSGHKGSISAVELLGARATHWTKCMKKAPGHLKRLGSENDRERARLWIDLTKAARQQHVWDVCRVAATFCLLYDDGRWRISGGDVPDNKSETGKTSSKKRARSATQDAKTPAEDDDKESESHQPDADILRMFAEVHFINGEALIQLLRDEGYKLNEEPTPPPIDSPMKSNSEFLSHDEDWKLYAEWIFCLNNLATEAFLRGIELGIELEESWIVCSGSVYLWNYNQHLVAAGRCKELVAVFEKVLYGLQKIGHSSIAVLLARICDVIARGLLTSWIPKPSEMTVAVPITTKQSRKKTGVKSGADKNALATPNVLSVAQEAAGDLNKALSVCEYALQVTNGSNLSDCIPTDVRHQVLATWVQVNQMLEQQLSPHYGSENEKLPAQQSMTKALVLLEMLTLNNNHMMQFNVMEISEVCGFVESCEWDDRCVELEVWTRLAKLAHLEKKHSLVSKCSGKALQLQSLTLQRRIPKNKSQLTHKEKTSLELLSLASCVMGESLMNIAASNPPARRQAMHKFVNSAKFANEAGSFTMVMSATRRWWNAALSLITSPLERQLLRPSVEALLACIVATSKNMETEEVSKDSNSTALLTEGESSGEMLNELTAQSEIKTNDFSNVNTVDDRSVMAAMYGLLIQTYVDENDWNKGLAVTDRAIRHMPRTHHRLLLFKHRIIMKAKLGKDVATDIAKFKDESESYVANMWHRVALSSVDHLEQLTAFQKSIEALQSENMRWQKFEYLLQLAAWTFSNEFPSTTTINIIEWASDLLLSMKFEVEVKKKKDLSSREKKKSGRFGKSFSKVPMTPKTDSQSGVTAEESEIFVEKVIGETLNIKMLNPMLQVNDLISSRQLEGLIRAHVMMAMVCGEGTEQHRVHCQLAYAFVMRLWKVTLTSAAIAMKNMPKIAPAEGDKKGQSAKGRAKSVPPIPEKPKRKGPVDAVPTSTVDWSYYEIPEEIKPVFNYDRSDGGMNKYNLTCAGLTVFYLLQLSDYLRHCGLNHLSLPVLNLANLITDVILESKTWQQLVILKQILVCYELHLLKAAKYWENEIRHHFLDNEEQVKSRQDLELKDIYKALAQQEEDRIREANANNPQQFDDKKNSVCSTVQSTGSLTVPVTLLGRKVGGVYLSEIWTEKAKLLLKLGYYQSCRKLLNESLSIANHHNHHTWRADVYHVLADLAVREGNTGQALQLIKKAQDVGGDEIFWQENIYLLIDAISLNPNPSNEDFVVVTSIVEHSLACLGKLELERPTKKSIIGFLRASLLSHQSFMFISARKESLQPHFDKLEEAENILQQLGFHRKLASIHIKHSVLLLELSKTELNKHDHLLKAIHLLETSVDNISELCTDVLLIDGDKGVSLPIYRKYLNLELHLVAVLLEAAALSIEEDQAVEAAEAAKAELQRKVEEFVGLSKQYPNEVEKEWDDVRNSFLHRSIGLLTSMHTTLPQQHSLRSEWLFLYGRCFHLLSIDCISLPTDYHWEVASFLPEPQIPSPPAEEKGAGVVANDDGQDQALNEEENESEEDEYVAGDKAINEKSRQINKRSELSLRFLTLATDILSQCIHMALPQQEYSIISKAALELVECFSQFDPQSAVSFLLLHQSAEFSKSMRSLLMTSSSDPTASQFSSLIYQESWLKEDSISTGLQDCLMRQQILKKLDEKYVAWNRTKLNPSHLSVLKDFTASYNFVVIQPSPAATHLYCAVISKQKSAIAPTESKSKAKEKTPPAPSSPRVSITRVKMDQNTHLAILEEYSDYQQQWMSFLLQREYQTHQLMSRKLMLQEISKDVAEKDIAGNVLEDHHLEEMRLKDEYLRILNNIEYFFSPLTSFINASLIQLITNNSDNHNPDVPVDPEFLVVLAPPTIQKYPLEALSCFQAKSLSSVCRDFSIQLFHWRSVAELEPIPEKKKGDQKGNPKTPKNAKKSARGSGRKGDPAKEPPPGSRTIESHSVRFIIDPHNDSSQTEKHPPERVFRQILQNHPNSALSRWSGFYGSDSTPSIGQWESMMQQCSMFIYYGMEKFIAQYPPSKLPSLNLRSSQLFLLIDKSQTHKSFRRQSKIDVDKTHNLLNIEKPIETAMLLSVCGTNSVCLNYLHTSSEENANKLEAFIESMLGGKSVGEGVRLLAHPPPDPTPANPDSGNTPTSPKSPLSVKEYSQEQERPVDSSTYNVILFGIPNSVFN